MPRAIPKDQSDQRSLFGFHGTMSCDAALSTAPQPLQVELYLVIQYGCQLNDFMASTPGPLKDAAASGPLHILRRLRADSRLGGGECTLCQGQAVGWGFRIVRVESAVKKKTQSSNKQTNRHTKSQNPPIRALL